jgi:hypothetical protein
VLVDPGLARDVTEHYRDNIYPSERALDPDFFATETPARARIVGYHYVSIDVSSGSVFFIFVRGSNGGIEELRRCGVIGLWTNWTATTGSAFLISNKYFSYHRSYFSFNPSSRAYSMSLR